MALQAKYSGGAGGGDGGPRGAGKRGPRRVHAPVAVAARRWGVHVLGARGGRLWRGGGPQPAAPHGRALRR